MVTIERIAEPGQSLRTTVPEILRAPAGRWTLLLAVAGKVQIGDGRYLEINQVVRIGGLRQVGSRPRGRAGWKRKGRRK